MRAFVALLLLNVAAAALEAQDVPAHHAAPTRDCQDADRILRTGNPAAKLDWAFSTIVVCPDAALALGERWKRPPSIRELGRLVYASRDHQDVRLVGPLQRIAADTGAAKLSRIAALSTLLSYLQLGFGLPLNEALLWGERDDFALQVTTDSDPFHGARPLTDQDRRRIVGWMIARSLTDPDPRVRRFLASLAAAEWVPAQAGSAVCGSLPGPEARLARLARYFRDSGYVEFRDNIEALSPSDTQAVVTDSRLCARVMEVAVNHLRPEPAWDLLARDGFEFSILRYGPYYAVVIVGLTEPGALSSPGWARMLILRRSDLSVLGVRLV